MSCRPNLQRSSRSWKNSGSFALSRVRSTRMSLAVESSRGFSYFSRRARFPLQEQFREAVFLGPVIDGRCPGPDLPLGIGEDDAALAPLGFQSVDHRGLDPGLPSGSGREPILQPETGDVLKVCGIVRHHGQVIDEGCRPDQ